MFNYPTTFTRDRDTILVTFRDVPEAITFGANKEVRFPRFFVFQEAGFMLPVSLSVE